MWAHMWPMYKAGVTPRGLDEPRDRGAKSGELVCGVRVAGWQDAPILTQPGPPLPRLPTCRELQTSDRAGRATRPGAPVSEHSPGLAPVPCVGREMELIV